MCLYPRLINNPKYKANKKNGGYIPPINDPRVLYVPYGCGNCIQCRKQKQREWMVRLLEDIKTNNNGKFITLTFSNESIQELTKIANEWTIYKKKYKWPTVKQHTNKYYKLPKPKHGYILDNEIATIAVHRLRERWRKKYKTSLRHWFVTELGHNGTENIHLHGIIWHNEPIEIIDKYWKYGFTHKGNYNIKTGKYHNYVNSGTIGYITKYVSKTDLLHQKYKPIILTSPGVGNNYTNTNQSNANKYKDENTNDLYKTSTGHKMTMPTYYKNKIYTDEEKEKLWLQKLDKDTRYVMGTKCKTEEEYYKLLEVAREKSKALGYGSAAKDYNREEYEHRTRIIKQQKRIENKK